jgi:Tfp pilus assembly protein PilF
MNRRSRSAIFCLSVALICLVPKARADTYLVIVTGKVTMDDGSPPPFTVSIERICSDGLGDKPGPLTNKKGEWIWQMEIDGFASRSCVLRASHPGYMSSTLDASNLNLTSHDTTLKVPALVLTGASADPNSIHVSGDNIPGKAKGPFEKAMKAVDAHNYDEAARLLNTAVTASPKFADGWHALGLVDEHLHKTPEARDAYTHAIEADPKLLPPYVTLARLCVRTKDWDCAVKTTDSLIKADAKKAYPEAYIHRAVAQYWLKDLAAAEASAKDGIQLDPKRKMPRAEYVLGRILEARGDINGAREHMQKYLELDATSTDAEMVQGHMLALGKAQGAQVEPELELP